MSTRMGLVRCDHCQRQFNPHSAARHIPWCKKQQADNKKHRLSADKLEALDRYRWRISYKPTNYPLSQRPTRSQLIIGNSRGQATRSSVNSSSISSPSASSTTSIASLGNSINTNQSAASRYPRARVQAPAVLPQLGKLKRSISSVTLTKRSGGASATIAQQQDSSSSKGSSASRTPVITECQLHSGDCAETNECSQNWASRRQQRARTKSVSDLAEDMGELVEVLAKRMEEIYLQNKQLLERVQRGASSSQAVGENCDNKQHHHDDDEFELCHHCRAKSAPDANYCHKCGCKMRPSNPTPSLQLD